MIFQLVHEAGTESADLLSSGNCEKNNFRELLRAERSKNAAAQYLRPLAILSPHDDHGLMLSVHSQFHDVVARHPWQLLCNDVLELNQIPHTL
jgi:hypothetical protein